MFQAIIDLSHAVSANAPNWEGAPIALATEVVSTVEKDGFYVRKISLDEHASTHMDAPAHIAQAGWTVDRIPPERFLGHLIVLDITRQSSREADYRLSMDDIAVWEQRHGPIPPGAVVIAHTGWHSRWNSPAAYRNADEKGALHFPGYSLEAARLLVSERHVVGIGIDTLSVDYGPSEDYPVHKFCAGHAVYQLENVDNLSAVPEAGAIAVVLPMKLENGSAAPVRILALVP